MADKNIILIVGQLPDPHIDKVINILEDIGERCFLFQRYNRQNYINLKIDSEIYEVDFLADARVSFRDIKSVWWRVKPYLSSEFTGGTGSFINNFVSREWMRCINSLSFFIPDAKWVNPLAQHNFISYKPYQLKLAKECGLKIPKTIISNDAEEIYSFFKEDQDIIYKTLSSFISPPQYIIFTSKIDKNKLIKEKEAISAAPGIFQKKIEKKYELRVFLIENKSFVVRIDSQSSSLTSLDWRKSQMRDMYSIDKLSSQTSQALYKFHKKANLSYAAYDFILDKKENEIFLECNPGGQWLWIEEKIGLPISKAITESLV